MSSSVKNDPRKIRVVRQAIIGCIEVGKEIGYRTNIGIPSKHWECLPRSKAAGAASCAHAQALGPV